MTSPDDLHNAVALLARRVADLERHEVTPAASIAVGNTVTEGPGIDLVASGINRQVGVGLDSILLAAASGAPAAEFAASGAGLAAALAAAGSGDIVLLPPQTIAGTSWSVPAGVTLYGIDRRASVLMGQLTGGNESVLSHLTVHRAASNGADLIAVQGPAMSTDILRLYDCVVTAEQAGSGAAIAVDVDDLGQVDAIGCELRGASVGGVGYALRAQSGLANLRHSQAYGSTDPFLT